MVNRRFSSHVSFASNPTSGLKRVSGAFCHDGRGTHLHHAHQALHHRTACMIGSLVKLGFWGGLVLLLLPIDGGPGTRDVSALETLLAARETVEDIRGICERRPAVCETGGAALETISQRAAKSARLALTYIESQDDGGSSLGETVDTDQITTSALPFPIPTARPAD
jgi:Family of unknown function (DUF5330)